MASHKKSTVSTAPSCSSMTGVIWKGKGKGSPGDSAEKQVQIDGSVVLKMEFTAQNLGKLFMVQALQEYNN
uniref:Uncharacterized protein n=1 Tax=Spermophilus dauricus TaxID=99837 RepID=A0A8C9NXR9_SPEDA